LGNCGGGPKRGIRVSTMALTPDGTFPEGSNEKCQWRNKRLRVRDKGGDREMLKIVVHSKV